MIKIHEIKSVAALILPLMAAFLAQKSMQFIDTFMMGWIGPDALAAGALSIAVFMTVLLFCMGMLSPVGVFIARAKGANDKQDMQSSLQHGLGLALFLALPCMLILWFAPYVLLVIGENPRVVNNVILFLHSLVWGLPGYLLFLALREFVSAFSLTAIIMFITLGSIPLTFVANYGLIYGKYGLPSLGIAGIGYAGAIVMWLMFLSLLIYSKKQPHLKQYVAVKTFQFDRSKAKAILHMGLPSGILLVLESSMFLFAAAMMGYFGVNALAAHQIAMQCAGLAYAVPLSLAIGTSLQIGHAVGARDLTRARRAVLLGFVIGLILTLLIAMIFIFLPEQLIGLFLQGNEPGYKTMEQLAISFLMIAAIFQCFDAMQSIANGSLRGLKDTLIPMLLSLGCYWCLGIGSAYYFAFCTHLGAEGIWYGLTLGLSSTGIVLTLRLIRRLKYM